MVEQREPKNLPTKAEILHLIAGHTYQAWGGYTDRDKSVAKKILKRFKE